MSDQSSIEGNNGGADAKGDVVVRGDGVAFAQDVLAGSHRIAADEPVALGGTDKGPPPYDLLLAALGSCTSITVTMYARRKGWPLQGIAVSLRHTRIHASDCAECETKIGMVDRIERDLHFDGPLSADQKLRLLDIADKYPVHRSLTSPIDIKTREI